MTAALLLASALLASHQAHVPRALERAMAEAGAGVPVPVIAVMEEQVDMQALVEATERLRKAERAPHVRSVLKPFAAQSQAELSALLDELRAEGQVTADEVLWIANARRISATPAALARIAALSGVDRLVWDPPLPLEATADVGPAPCVPPPPAPAPGSGDAPAAAEPNIVALQATQLWAVGVTGRGSLILNVDDGVNQFHPDVAPAIWHNPIDVPNGVDDDLNGYVDDVWGWDFASNDNDPSGDFHGMNTTGIVCGNGALNGGVATGMAPDTKLASARINGQGNMIAAYQYAISIGASCVTSSHSLKWPSMPDYHLFRQACDAELAAGIIHANSIGNQGQFPFSYPIPYNIATPGNCPTPWHHPGETTGGRSSIVGCAGLLLPNDDLYLDSGQGPAAWENVLLMNPGYVWFQNPAYWDYPYNGGAQPGLVKPDLSAYTNVKTTQGASSYSPSFGGTSAATPHLGGALCLMVDANEAVPPRQISQALQETAADLGPPGKDNRYGAGKIQVYDAARKIIGAVTAYPPDPALGSTVSLDLTGPNGAPYLLGLAFTQGSLPTSFGITLGLGMPLVVLSSGSLTGVGTPVTLPIGVPSDPIFANFSVYLQLVTNDTGGLTHQWLASLVERVTLH